MIVGILLGFFISCGGPNISENDKFIQEVNDYLSNYNKKYRELLIESAEAAWKLNTFIKEGDTITSTIAEEKEAQMVRFTGSIENIEMAKKYLEKKDLLNTVQIKQLQTILYIAGNSPETAKEIVQKLIKANNEQTKKLFGFNYVYQNDTLSTNEIDSILNASTNMSERLSVWNISKEVGKNLKPGLAELQSLRNTSVQALNYKNYFDYQTAEYGLSDQEMLEICQNMVREIWPLYREIHTWTRYELAKKYKKPVPDLIPAHWIPNRWAQDWTSLVEVKGLNLDETLQSKGAEWIVQQGEAFYVSLGFDSLPKSFYEKSSLYPLPKAADYKKNNHASAWHMDNDQDVRSLMSIEPNTEWWETTLHELGHIYYYLTYANADVPVILRSGANRAFHEAMGTLIGLASLQKPFLEELKLIEPNLTTNDTMMLLKEALNYVVLIPWSAGVMTEFEYELYANNLPENQYNQAWWRLVEKYQGIAPADKRGEEYCDAATKTHINNDPAQYYDYALSTILLSQFHEQKTKNILKQNPHATNYWGNKEVGDFLKKLMYPGASKDWRELLKENLGEEISAKPMLEYFSPLLQYLQRVNKGRTYTLPETI